MKINRIWIGVLAFGVVACGKVEDTKTPVVTSLLGKEYFEPDRPKSVQARLDSNLKVAKTNLQADPSEENYIWYGRRLGYLSRFQDAVDAFTEGIGKYPSSAKLYRHRGHRFISLRRFDEAIEDLKQASTLMAATPLEIEPDGQPNRINTPLSSTQFNVWYHLALAYYLKGDFVNAEKAYDECLRTSVNDDLVVATVDWMYMNYRRQGKDLQAGSVLERVTDSMTIVENESYFRRCQLYRGKLQPDSLLKVPIADLDQADLVVATQGYGVGNWYLYNGDTAKAQSVFELVIGGKFFGAFGFIAAEAELARLGK